VRFCIAFVAIVPAFFVLGENNCYAQVRPLKKHHERFKQRFLPRETPQPLEFEMPYRGDSLIYPVVPPTLVPDAGETLPNESPDSPAEPTTGQPVPEGNTTGNADSNTPGNNAEATNEATQPSDAQDPSDPYSFNPSQLGGFDSPNADYRSLFASQRVGGTPLSGPLNTFSEFFAPACQNVSVEVMDYGSDVHEITLATGQIPMIIGGAYGSKYGFELEETDMGGYVLPPTVLLTNYPADSPLPLPPTMEVASIVAEYDKALEAGIRSTEPGSQVRLLGKRADQSGQRSAGYYDLIQEYEISSADSTSDILVLACGAPGSQLGRQKIAEQNSPIPQNRIFFDSSFFQNAIASASPTDVQRFVPGFEKTFHGGQCSIDVRLPMGLAINSTQYDGSFDTRNAEFGNASVVLKQLITRSESCLVSGGFGFRLPTANDVVLRSGSRELYRMDNRQVRVVPFLAALRTQGDWIWQNWGQFDLGLNGNEVFFNSRFAGDLKEQNYLYLDSSLSRWVYRNFRSGIGWALTGEMHYNQTVGESDVVRFGNSFAGDRAFDASIVNTTFGSTFVVGQTTFSTGYASPLTNDRGFDGEIRLFVNRFF
jgi:hypothetical protein